MPRLADHRAVVACAEEFQKSPDAPRVEGERRRELHQQHAALCAESCTFGEEPLERLPGARQRTLMGDQLGDLHREGEVRRNGGGPALVDGGRMGR